jgi:hypothetical protein
VSDADVTKALHDDAAVPVDGEGKWIDSGRWREVGVVHWHLIEPREWPVNDSARFSTERAEAERGRASAGVAGSPHEVATWMTEVTDKLIAENHADEYLAAKRVRVGTSTSPMAATCSPVIPRSCSCRADLPGRQADLAELYKQSTVEALCHELDGEVN